MSLSEVNLSQLVAELQQRLRRFASGPPGSPGSPVSSGSPASPASSGALDASGRAALACRLLAVAVEERVGAENKELAGAFRDLAGALDGSSAPLPGSTWESDLAALVKSLETLARAWDDATEVDLDQAWAEVRRLGDGVWGLEKPAEVSVLVETASIETSETGEVPLVWLLVAGSIRRVSLERRLAGAGFQVECLASAETVAQRLKVESPVAVICDDAAPTRHHTCLTQSGTTGPLPLVLILSRPPSRLSLDVGGLAWGPPYQIEDLLSQINRS